MTMIADNLHHVRSRIEDACAAAHRPRDAVKLLAVSKTFPPSAVQDAFDAGQRAFGENYVQEGVEKITLLQALPIEWHLIGPLQSNKTRVVAEHFDWVHSVDRLKIAERLGAQRPAGRAPLQVCLQVNVDGGANKSGVASGELAALARAAARLPGIALRGLMSIPEPASDAARQEAVHRQLAQLHHATGRMLADEGLLPAAQWDTLSLGMSGDLEAAIAAGSTLVRVGTAIFGGRARPAPGGPTSSPA